MRRPQRSALSGDIEFHLDASTLYGDLGLDADFFVRAYHPDPHALISNLGHRPPAVAPRKYGPGDHSLCLANDMLIVERDYLEWRKDHPRESAVCSTMVWMQGGAILDTLISEAALEMVNARYERLSAATIQYLHYKYQGHFPRQLAVIKRAWRRAASDLGALRKDQLLSLARMVQSWIDTPRLYHEHGLGIGPTLTADQRRPLKRSLRFLADLIGDEPTRLFLSRSALKVEGRLCDYEIKRSTANLSTTHGGADLRLLKKHTGEMIAKCCIYTPNVPLLDHVASLIMHIQSGEEETLLRVGNLFSIDQDIIRTVPALQPFYQVRRDTRQGIVFTEERDHRRRMMARFFMVRGKEFKIVDDHAAKVRAMTIEMRRYVMGQLGGLDDGRQRAHSWMAPLTRAAPAQPRVLEHQL